MKFKLGDRVIGQYHTDVFGCDIFDKQGIITFCYNGNNKDWEGLSFEKDIYRIRFYGIKHRAKALNSDELILHGDDLELDTGSRIGTGFDVIYSQLESEEEDRQNKMEIERQNKINRLKMMSDVDPYGEEKWDENYHMITKFKFFKS